MIAVFIGWWRMVWAHPWMRQVALVAGLLIALIIGKEAYKRKVEAGERRRNELAAKAKEQAAVIENLQTSSGIKEDIRHDRVEALAAGNSLPEFTTPAQLRNERPDIADIIFRSDR